MLMRGRIAPTPSGYLHTGNVMNFVLTWLWVRKAGGQLRLRIDDSDTTRSKPGYIQDIFDTLNWMGLDWDEGPRSPAEQESIYSQALRAARYADVTQLLIATGKVFACSCSRKDLLVRSCNCREKGIALNQPDTALRIVTPNQPVEVKDVKNGVQHVVLKDDMKDFVIRRRDGIPAYQICSLADDIDHGINLIIRGNDLISSTAAQLYLASLTGNVSFAATTFYHHPLLNDEQGNKLSKSAGSLSVKTIREQGGIPEQLYARISQVIGLNETCTSLNEMLNYVMATPGL
jgi:glutamyl/glutaminyl-tRNA synthetase